MKYRNAPFKGSAVQDTDPLFSCRPRMNAELDRLIAIFATTEKRLSVILNGLLIAIAKTVVMPIPAME
jgi:hypothetical protein